MVTPTMTFLGEAMDRDCLIEERKRRLLNVLRIIEWRIEWQLAGRSEMQRALQNEAKNSTELRIRCLRVIHRIDVEIARLEASKRATLKVIESNVRHW